MQEQAQRLQNLINALKTNQLRLSKKIGVPYSQTNSIFHGKAGFSSGYIKKLSLKFPEVNTHWLLTGSGEMFISSERNEIDGLVGERDAPYKKSINPLQISPYDKDDELRKTLGNNLLGLVITWEMKKYQLFEIIMPGVAKQSISNYLSGTSQVPLYALIRLERITGIAIIEWITREIKSGELPPEPTPGITKQDYLIRELRALLDRVGA